MEIKSVSRANGGTGQIRLKKGNKSLWICNT